MTESSSPSGNRAEAGGVGPRAAGQPPARPAELPAPLRPRSLLVMTQISHLIGVEGGTCAWHCVCSGACAWCMRGRWDERCTIGELYLGEAEAGGGGPHALHGQRCAVAAVATSGRGSRWGREPLQFDRVGLCGGGDDLELDRGALWQSAHSNESHQRLDYVCRVIAIIVSFIFTLLFFLALAVRAETR